MTPQAEAILAHVFDAEDMASSECALAQARMSGLILRTLASRDPATTDAPAWSHIQACPACGPLYRDSLAQASMEMAGAFEAPPLPAGFDLSYLDAAAAAAPGRGASAGRQAAVAALSGTAAALSGTAAGLSWWVDAAGRLVIRLAANVLAGLQAGFGGPALQPAHLKSGAGRGEVTIDAVGVDRVVAIRAEAQPRDPAHCTLEIAVDIPSRGGWPHLGGIEIGLRHGEVELARQETDAFGHAVFEDVPVDLIGELHAVIETPGR